jgi:hypothetical protein
MPLLNRLSHHDNAPLDSKLKPSITQFSTNRIHS